MQLVLYRNNNVFVEPSIQRKLNQHCVEISKQHHNIEKEDRNQFQAFSTLELIKEWKVKELRLSNYDSILGGNERAGLLPEISHIKFPSLRLLNLHGNGIESIEGLSRIWMPSLQTLRLASNSLICLADLRKANWPSLLEIGLSKPIALEMIIEFLKEIQFLVSSPRLKSIIIEWT